jgi:hypothetical protein
MTPSPSRPPAPAPLAVILAAIDARETIARSLARWLDVLDGGDELIAVVSDEGDGMAGLIEANFPGVRVLRRPAGRLAPELWRDGLDASDSPLVAFSTAQMRPAPGWRRMMLDRLEATGAAAVGGPIVPAAGLTPTDRAVYLLRYVQYLRPLPTRIDVEPPGDNAVYRRECLGGLESLRGRGFWEVEIHRELRRRGHRLAMADADEAAVAYQGGSRLVPFLRQRYAHARRYGGDRAGGWSTPARLARLATTPVVPAVMLRRIFATLSGHGQDLAPWLRAVPALLPMLAAWSIGEAHGLSNPRRGRPPDLTIPPNARVTTTSRTLQNARFP